MLAARNDPLAPHPVTLRRGGSYPDAASGWASSMTAIPIAARSLPLSLAKEMNGEVDSCASLWLNFKYLWLDFRC